MEAHKKAKSRRVTLTAKQLEESAAVELQSVCESIAEDGRLTDEEIDDLKSWLDEHSTEDMPAIEFLNSLVKTILADGEVTRDERRELLRGIERVLPKQIRDVVSAQRKEVESEANERNRCVARFDFMIAGAKRDEYSTFIKRRVREDQEILFQREPNNSYDRNAVKVLSENGKHIGYVPREEAPSVARYMDGAYAYIAYVKKILGYGRPIPVVVAEIYQKDADVEGLRSPSELPTPQSGHLGTVAVIIILAIMLYFLI